MLKPKRLISWPLASSSPSSALDVRILARTLSLLVDLNTLEAAFLDNTHDTFLKTSRLIALVIIRSLKVFESNSVLDSRFHLLVDLAVGAVQAIWQAILGAAIDNAPLSRSVFQSITNLNARLLEIQTFLHRLADLGPLWRWIKHPRKANLISKYHALLAADLKIFKDARYADVLQVTGRDAESSSFLSECWNDESDSSTGLLLDMTTGTTLNEYYMIDHIVAVTSVAVSPPDGRYVVSGFRDGSIRLWDAKTGKEIGKPMLGHAGKVTSVAFSPDGRLVASGSTDQTVRLWDSNGGVLYRPLQTHADAVTSVAFSPDGRFLLSGSRDGTLRLWDVATGARIGGITAGSMNPHSVTSVAFSPDGSTIVSISADRTVRRWDSRTFAALGPPDPLERHTDLLASVLISPDMVNLLSHTSYSDDNVTPRIWYVSSPPPPVAFVAREPDRLRVSAGTSNHPPTPDNRSRSHVDNDSDAVTIRDVDGEPIDLSQKVTVVDGPLTGGRFCDIYTGRLETGTGTEEVAMKQLRTFLSWNNSQRTAALNSFRREVKLWSRFRHEFILPFYGFAIYNDVQFFMISPWIKNGHCMDYLGRHPDTDRRTLLWQVAVALHYLHSGGAGIRYVHGDIKGDNILISDAGNALLADFGLMRHVEAVSNAMATPSGISPAGHLRFAAPELLVDETTRPSPASDVFAFAGLVFQVFTGQPPFPHLRDPQVLTAVMQGVKPRRPENSDVIRFGLDDKMWDLACQCWEHDPACRPTMGEIVTRLAT